MTVVTGAYLRALRVGRGFTQAEIAEAVNTTVNTIWRIEAGQQEPKAVLIVRLLASLGGRAEDLANLMANPNADELEAQKAAAESIRAAALQATPEERRVLAERLRQLADDIASGRTSLR